jgi:hypothetical protein
MELRQEGSNETDCGVFVGEDPDHPLPSSDLFVEPFLGVGALEDFSQWETAQEHRSERFPTLQVFE